MLRPSCFQYWFNWMRAQREAKLSRLLAEAEHIKQQTLEDTCEEHGVWLCPACFDVNVIKC